MSSRGSLPARLSGLDKLKMVLMLFVLTNAFLDMKELERGELDVTSPWLVAGRFERKEDWVDGIL